jgi:hypothetical protein
MAIKIRDTDIEETRGGSVAVLASQEVVEAPDAGVTVTDASAGDRTLRLHPDPLRRIFISHAAAWTAAAESQLNELLSLAPGWDTYGARVVSLDAVAKAVRLLHNVLPLNAECPELVPINNGGVTIAWRTPSGIVEVDVDDADYALFVDLADGSVFEGPLGGNESRLVAALKYLGTLA